MILRSSLRKREGGFTLVELMIVVAIIGVLAALAIYGVARYLKHSKTAEATRALGTMATGSQQKYQVDTDASGVGTGPFGHQFCASTSITPATGVPVGTKVLTASSEYEQPGWACLKFLMTGAQYFAYTYTSNAPVIGPAATYTGIAQGDLDGNGASSLFTLPGSVNASTGEAMAGRIFAVNEDE